MNAYERIKKTRKEKGMTQTELAEKSGYADKSMIARIENGQIDLALSKLDSIANALNVESSYLLGFTDTAMIEDIAESFRQLNDEGKEKLRDYANLLASSEAYKKHSTVSMVEEA